MQIPPQMGSADFPDFSLVLPCYNEEDNIRITTHRLVRVFRREEINCELVLVDNGSTDATGSIIQELIDEGLPILKVKVEKNEGYGNGVIQGLKACRAALVGFMVADGQVNEQDVANLFEFASYSRTPKLFKITRRFRMDGLYRRMVSYIYNGIVYILFGNLGTMDINANPKILRRVDLDRLNLQSKDWFIDVELMLKAKKIGLGVFELNTLSRMRFEGASHVRGTTIVEFIRNLLRYKFTGKIE